MRGGATNKEVAIYLRTYNKMSRGLRQATAQIKRFAGNVKREIESIAKRAGIVLAGVATASLLIGANFEQGVANVGSVANATAAEMQMLEDHARSLGATTAYSATKITEAQYALASSGQDTIQILSSTEGVVKLAGATLSDMGSTAELTTAAISIFGLAAEDTDRVVNTFGAGIQSSTLNMERLADSMTYAGPAAKLVGMNIEQTVAALGLLHNAGLRGSIAGTSLNAALKELLNPTKELSRVLGDVTIRGDGLAAVLERLRGAQLTPEQMAQLFDERSLKAMMALLGAGADGFREMTAKVTGTSAAFEMYDRQMDTTRGRFAEFRGAMEESALGVFDTIQPVVNRLLEVATQFVVENQDTVRAFLVGLVEKAIVASGEFRKAWNVAKIGFTHFIMGIREAAGPVLGKALDGIVERISGMFGTRPLSVVNLDIEGVARQIDYAEAEIKRLEDMYSEIPDDRNWLGRTFGKRTEQHQANRDMVRQWREALSILQGVMGDLKLEKAQAELVAPLIDKNTLIDQETEAFLAQYRQLVHGSMPDWSGWGIPSSLQALSTFEMFPAGGIPETLRAMDAATEATQRLRDASEDSFDVMEAGGVAAAHSIESAIHQMTDSALEDLGGLGSFASSVFGSILGAAARLGIATALPTLAPALGVTLPGKAAGGPVAAARAYLVGERGPEVFVPNASGTIIPNHHLAAAGAASSVTTISTPISVIVQSEGGLDDQMVRRRVAEALEPEFDRLQREYFDPHKQRS